MGARDAPGDARVNAAVNALVRATDLSRRDVLRWGAAGLAVPAALVALGGCGASGPDPLLGLAATAGSDAALIEEAIRRSPDLAARLTPAGAARAAHAAALGTEIHRLDSSVALPTASQAGSATLDGVRAALDRSARTAADAVPGLPGYRAALVGSIAACCAAYRSLLA
jgi:hypothetical protein